MSEVVLSPPMPSLSSSPTMVSVTDNLRNRQPCLPCPRLQSDTQSQVEAQRLSHLQSPSPSRKRSFEDGSGDKKSGTTTDSSWTETQTNKSEKMPTGRTPVNAAGRTENSPEQRSYTVAAVDSAVGPTGSVTTARSDPQTDSATPAKRRKVTQQEREEKRLEKEEREREKAEMRARKEEEKKLKEEEKRKKEEERKAKEEERRKKAEEREEERKAREEERKKKEEEKEERRREKEAERMMVEEEKRKKERVGLALQLDALDSLTPLVFLLLTSFDPLLIMVESGLNKIVQS